MGLFDKIFRKRGDETNLDQSPMAVEQDQTFREKTEKTFSFNKGPENFKAELFESFERYFSTPDLEFNINLTDVNGTTYEPHEAVDSTFEEWREIRSKWDRMSLLYGFWDETELDKLQKWQKIERYVKDRRGLQALDFFKSNITNDDFIDIRAIIAASKLHRILLLNDKAKYYAEAAYKLRPDLDIVKTEYASTLHLSESDSDNGLAHKLINEVIENRASKSESKEIALLNYFEFSKDYIDSSVFAVSFLNVGNCVLGDWNALAEEYYYCPIFRYEHAVKLASSGESLFALAKLNSLSTEFPWFKKALITTIDNIDIFRKETNNPDFMKEELLKLKYNLSLNK
jgi:hypothetical protein